MKRALTSILALLLVLSLFTGAGVRKEVTWEDYQQWLVDNIAAISPFPEPVAAIVWETGSWEEIEAGYNSGPWGKFFDEDCYNASTWEEWDGGDIDLTAPDNTTVYVLIPAGTDIGEVITIGESLGWGAKEFEGQYLGSFYLPGQGILAEPLDIY